MLPTRPLLLLSMLLLAASAGCDRKKEPSPQYEQARTLFSKLYAEKLNDAFVDPGMDDVEALLAQVPADSLDAKGAAELSKRIADGRAEREKFQAEVASAVERATASDPSYQPITPLPEDAEPDAGAAADAGSDQPTPGMSLADFTRRFTTCFISYEPIQIQGRGVMETFVLKDIQLCRTRHAGYVGQALLFENARFWGTGDLSKMQRRLTDGGVPPDAGR